MKVCIKNMVCPRCLSAVENILKKQGIAPIHMALGEAELPDELTAEQLKRLNEALKAVGFELIGNKEETLVEQIRTLIRQRVREMNGDGISLTDFLENRLHVGFLTLNRTFQQIDGRSIERYFLLQRIEYVKELLQYDELSVKEIAWRTGFSSLPHLSRQFKQITGVTPTDYKLQSNSRTPIDSI